ncbi:MAG: helix-turn-helix transcriptional regulator [Nitrospirae bacterium]|nr:helix-turn-helix transcriptional regulator [Nitrospirota bacterium]
MGLELLTDNEIIEELGKRLDLVRRSKQVQLAELVKKSGVNHDSLNRFFNGKGSISLKTFVRLVRGLGEADKLDKLFVLQNEFNPTQQKPAIPKKRIYAKNRKPGAFKWGDEK